MNAQSISDAFAVENLILGLFDQQGAEADVNRYLEGYFNPALVGIGYGVSSGWFNTAESHKPWGFDLTFTITAAFVPEDERSFSMADASTFTSSPEVVPNIAGASIAPTFDVNPGGIAQIDGLEGLGDYMEDVIGIVAIPTPMVQAGLGLPKGIELKGRFIPRVKTSGMDMQTWGIGAMVNIKQFIPPLKLAPFDLSAFAGFQQMSFNTTVGATNTRVQNGMADMGFRTLTFQGIISKKMSVLTVYGAAGVSNTNLFLDILGEFDVDDDGDFETDTSLDVADPLSMQVALTGPRFNAGFRLKMAVVTLHADYAIQKYHTLTVGLGFSVR